jgi:hypothetical protein
MALRETLNNTENINKIENRNEVIAIPIVFGLQTVWTARHRCCSSLNCPNVVGYECKSLNIWIKKTASILEEDGACLRRGRASIRATRPFLNHCTVLFRFHLRHLFSD